MDFKELSDRFGGCIFPECLAIDLEKAARSTLQLQSRDAPLSERAASLLTKDVFHMVQGNFSEAFAALRDLERVSTQLTVRWQVRTKAYTCLAKILQRSPPLFRFRPDSEASASILADATHDLRAAREELKGLMSQIDESEDHQSISIDKLELKCLYMASAEYNDFLWMQNFLNPEHPNIQMRQLLQEKTDCLDIDFFPQTLIAALHSHQMHTTANYLECLNVEASFTRGSPDAKRKFLQRLQSCISRQDYPSCASACVMLGDRSYAPIMTSPLALGLIIQGTLEGYEANIWDTTDFEVRRKLLLDVNNENRYREALNVFTMINASRGMGAVYLRQACVLHMSSVSDLDSQRTSAANEKFHEAAKLLDNAMTEFKLDEAQTVLTKAHRILLDITTQEHEKCVSRSGEIGAECKKLDNPQLAYSIATLMLRFGRRRWLDGRRMDIFMMSIRCAESCVEGVKDNTGMHEAQSAVYLHVVAIARARCQYEIGSIPAALGTLETAEARLRQAFTALDHLRTMRPGYDEGVMSVRENLNRYFDRVSQAIRPRAADPSSVGATNSDFASLVSDPSSILPVEVQRAAEIVNRLSRAFSQAIAEALSALDEAHLEGFHKRMEDFLKYVTSRFDSNEQTVAGFHVRAICILDRYVEACAVLPKSLPPRFGGTGTDKLFEAVASFRFEGIDLGFGAQHLRNQAERSIGNCVWAKDWKTAGRVLSAVNEAHPQYLQELSESSAARIWQAQAEIGAIYEHNGHPEEALAWYLRSADILETQRGQTIDVNSRIESMDSLNSSELFGGLVRVCLELQRRADGNKAAVATPSKFGLPAKDWNVQAFLFAEQARARLLLDMLTTGNGADASLFDQWRQDSHEYRQYEDLKYNRGPRSGGTQIPPPDAPNQGSYIEKLWSMGYQLLSKASFQRDLDPMLKSIPTDSVLLHYNVDDEGMVIFALKYTGVVQTCRTDLRRKTLQKRVLPYQRMMLDSKPHVGTKDHELANDVGRFLSDHLLLPVSGLVKATTHIIFGPCSELNAFPLASLPFEGKQLITQKSCSYVPSLAVLDRITRSDATRALIRAAVFANREKRVRVPNVGATAVADMFSAKATVTNNMTSDAFLKTCRDADLIFISTHGHRPKDAASSWQAYLTFKPDTDSRSTGHPPDGGTNREDRLKVMDLTQLRTKAAITIFSACLGATGQVTKGNDLIGFSHAMLESGTQAYVGALWEVADWATMILMMLFAEGLADAHNRRTTSECLQQAQIRFQELDVEKAKAIIERARVSWDRSKHSHPEEWYKDCRFCLDDLEDDLDEKDFTDPYYWAAWVLIGNGDLRLVNAEKAAFSLPTGHFNLVRSSMDSGRDAKGSGSGSATPSLPPIFDLSALSLGDIGGQSSTRTSHIRGEGNQLTRSISVPEQETPPPPLPPRPSREHSWPATQPMYASSPGKRPVTNLPTLRPVNSPLPVSGSSGSRTPVSGPRQPLTARPQQQLQRPSQVPSRGESRSPFPQQQTQYQRKPVPHRLTPGEHSARRQSLQSHMPAQTGHTRPQQHNARTQSSSSSITPTPRRPSAQHPDTRLRPQGSPNPQKQPQPPKKDGTVRRIMKHPGTKMAFGVGSALVLGGAMGAKVSGYMDQWSSGNYAGGSGFVWGGGGFGDDDGEGDEGGEYVEEECYVAEEYDGQQEATFEDDLMYGEGQEGTFADDLVYTEQGGSGTGGQAEGYDDPYQVGPCFEDNLLVSAARP